MSSLVFGIQDVDKSNLTVVGVKAPTWGNAREYGLPAVVEVENATQLPGILDNSK